MKKNMMAALCRRHLAMAMAELIIKTRKEEEEKEERIR